MNSITPRIAFAGLCIAIAVAGLCVPYTLAQTTAPLDPADWGEDHVGKPIPEYVTGGECLFCHRFEVGPQWQDNRHNQSMQIVGDVAPPALEALRGDDRLKDLADEVFYIVGDTRMKRFLKPNGRYGQAALLKTGWTPPTDAKEGGFTHADDPDWDDDQFGNRCAGCHATAVETEYNAFSTFSHDCFVCHGVIPAAHSSTPSLALFAKTSKAGPLVEMSVCASCHLRGGESKSSGLPYPNQFVPGDNLFKDFLVGLSKESIADLNPADRHVYESARETVIEGKSELSCLVCHDIHKKSTRKHRTLKRLQRHDYCVTCHEDPEDYKSFIRYDVHSDVCEY